MMDWLRLLVGIAVGFCIVFALVRYVRSCINSGRENRDDEFWQAGERRGASDVRVAARELGLATWKCGGEFRWKTRSEIADEVIAERQKAQQERFRELWGNAVCKCEETL